MKVGLLKKISLALGFVLWVTGSVCASPADEEGANKANNNLVKVLVIGLHAGMLCSCRNPYTLRSIRQCRPNSCT